MGKTYKMVSVVGTSEDSIEDAVRSAVADASRTLRDIYWFEVDEVRGRVENGEVAEIQVKVQLGLKVDGE